MTIRAKFRCVSVVTTFTSAEHQSTVNLSPVITGSEENKAFYQFTPCGSIALQVVRADTATAFKPGAEYYVDFIEATE